MSDFLGDYRPNSALHPGRLLREELTARAMSQRDFAERMRRPPQVINQILREKKSITPETALGIEKVLGIDAQFWINLQGIHDLAVERMAEDAQLLERDGLWLQRLPVRKMEQFGWIEAHSRKSGRLWELLKFFAIPSFDALPPTPEAIGFRVTEKAKVDEWALRAWLRQGEREAATREVVDFDPQQFRAAIDEIRSLTVEAPEVSWPRMQRLCADAGIVLIALPHLPKTGANGVARWLKPHKAMIQLNLRYRWADIFWFTFFHEAAHVLEGPSQRVFVDLDNGGAHDDEAELKADRFATDSLTPPDPYQAFIERGHFSGSAVQKFADQIEIHPGVVVGRLQHDGHLLHDRLNSLRDRWQFADPGTVT